MSACPGATSALLLALVCGLLISYQTHLKAGYVYGYNCIDGGMSTGGWRVRQAVISLENAEGWLRGPTGPDVMRTVFRGIGLALTAALLALRTRYLRFPIHPLGLAIAGTFGWTIWFPIMVAWLAKTITLRLGGLHAYRQVEPAFIGLAVGHFVIGGGLWGIIGVINEQLGVRYLVWFP